MVRYGGRVASCAQAKDWADEMKPARVARPEGDGEDDVGERKEAHILTTGGILGTARARAGGRKGEESRQESVGLDYQTTIQRSQPTHQPSLCKALRPAKTPANMPVTVTQIKIRHKHPQARSKISCHVLWGLPVTASASGPGVRLTPRDLSHRSTGFSLCVSHPS